MKRCNDCRWHDRSEHHAQRRQWPDLGAHRAAPRICLRSFGALHRDASKAAQDSFCRHGEEGSIAARIGGANWQYVDSALNPHYVWVIALRSGESGQHVCRHRHADAGDAVSFEGRRPELGRSGRWKWRRSARRSARRDSPASPSIRWSRIMSGRASKWTARVTAATAAIPGASWK